MRTLAFEIAENSGRSHPFHNGSAGKDWYQSFARRHNISSRMPQPLSYARARNCNPEVIEDFFDRLSELYTKHDFSPSQIFNADETGVSCVHKPSKVCAERGQKTCGLLQVEKKDERILSLHVVLHLVILYH